MPRQAAPLIVFAVPEAETACRVTCVSYASAVLCTALSERFFGTERLIVLAACKTLAPCSQAKPASRSKLELPPPGQIALKYAKRCATWPLVLHNTSRPSARAHNHRTQLL